MIGAKLLRIDDLEQVEAQIPITLCKLEKVFPPSFFDVMVHLPIHLAYEAMLGGPVQYRWIEFAQIHVDSTQHLSDDEWNRQFIEWFQDKVAQLHKEDDSRIMEDLLALSRGPTKYVLHYNGYIVNGYRFHAEAYDKNLWTQNYGVVDVGETDKHSDNIDYYGVLTDVLELQFMDRRVVLFECKWFDAYDKTKGVKIDEYGIVSVNLGRFLKINEPFVLAEQASQVFYANDNSNRGVSRTDIPFSPSTDQVMQYNQFTETSVVAKGRGKGLRSMSNAQGVRTMNKNYLSVEKGHIPSFPSTDELMQYIKTNSSSAQGKYQMLKSMCSIEDSENEGRSFNQNDRYVSQNMSRPSADQGWRTMNKKFLAFDCFT
ncbi:hypothetical protein MTR67_013569 [Solanum verrucosum]|uniref:DUF4218 domain-containing protein n=1 Tax=Solanum verrucosum TaxID=315347 RepID=A0AAF0TIJ3_SOLVR|nr:hypothetical protein MTR67_013569 [Solanum verrucosum]